MCGVKCLKSKYGKNMRTSRQKLLFCFLIRKFRAKIPQKDSSGFAVNFVYNFG